MSGHGKRKTEKGDARGGGFFLLPHCLLNSEALRTASPRAVKVLLALCVKHTGFNNGAIGLGFRDLAEWMDCQNHTAHDQALGELIARGLVAVECEHPRAQRLSTEYRLTFIPTADGPATNDYLTWRVGDAGTLQKRSTGNFRVAMAATENAIPVAVIATGGETSRCDSLNGADAKPPFLEADPVAIGATHIPNHLGRPPSLSKSNPRSPSNMDGPVSAAPEPDELRGRVLAVLDEAPRGSQGQLAAMAAIRPAALSKFLNHEGPLNAASRIRLTIALPRVAIGKLERVA